MEAVRQVILLLFYASLNTSLSIPVLRQRIPQQACVYAHLLEVQSEVDPKQDIPVLVGAPCLSQDRMGKDEGFLRVSLPINHPSPLRSQYCSEPAPHLSWGSRVPAS